jgi:hypothetical protein
MSIRSRDRLGSDAVGRPVLAARRRWLPGLLYFAGAVLAAYFLVIQWGILLVAVKVAKAIASLSRPDMVRIDDDSQVTVTAAVVIATGICLTLGLLALTVRSLSGKPYPDRNSITLFLVLSVGLVGAALLLARRTTAPVPIPASYVGLEGLWHPASSDKHAYRFNPDGSVDAWWEGLGGGKFGSWSRSGQTVTVRTIRNWHFVGTLAGGSITGTLFESSSGKVISPESWVRPVKP